MDLVHNTSIPTKIMTYKKFSNSKNNIERRILMKPNILVDLPDEVNLYKSLTDNEEDPIKKEVFSFSEVVFIMNNILPFTIEANLFYNEKDLNNTDYITKSYINSKFSQEKENQNIKINKEEIKYITNFLDFFYDLKAPITDYKNPNVLWLYPKIKIKEFISDCISDNKYEDYYYEDETLNKLILLMAGFVRYEYNNADENIINEIHELNYPTLILANISLYEKGLLKLHEESNGIAISLDSDSMDQRKTIFTKDVNKLKMRILDIVNYTDKTNYTFKDFMN